MDALITPPLALALAGLIIGIVFGALVLHTNACAMGAIFDMVTYGDRRRFRSWLLAIGVAMLAAQAMQAAGLVDLTRSIYLPPVLDWAGACLGGLLFGFGMVLAGGCASKNLVRAGGGDLRSAVNLIVLGVTAYAAIGGLLGPARVALARLTSIDLGRLGLKTQGLGGLVGLATGLTPEAGALVAGYLLGFGLIIGCLSDRSFRTSGRQVLAGLGIGACVAAGWAATGLLYDDLAVSPVPPASLTFVRPAGDSLEWLMRTTAAPMPGFGVATVAGTLLGAFLVAWATGRFRWSTFADVADTRRNLGGAMLMGLGGVLATGCTIGQGITGLSTLALGSLLAFAGILCGGILGVKALERGAG